MTFSSTPLIDQYDQLELVAVLLGYRSMRLCFCCESVGRICAPQCLSDNLRSVRSEVELCLTEHCSLTSLSKEVTLAGYYCSTSLAK